LVGGNDGSSTVEEDSRLKGKGPVTRAQDWELNHFRIYRKQHHLWDQLTKKIRQHTPAKLDYEVDNR
jgi:hypothetical protein